MSLILSFQHLKLVYRDSFRIQAHDLRTAMKYPDFVLLLKKHKVLKNSKKNEYGIGSCQEESPWGVLAVLLF